MESSVLTWKLDGFHGSLDNSEIINFKLNVGAILLSCNLKIFFYNLNFA